MIPNVVISYVPLFIGEPGAVYGNERIQEFIKEIDSNDLGAAKGAVWTLEGGASVVTLVMDKAQEIADHLKAWSENRENDWFTLQLVKNQGGYGIAIMPDLEKSVARLKKIYGGTDKDANGVKVIFRPLVFASSSSEAFDQAEANLPETIKVFLLDSELVNEKNFTPNYLNHRIGLGEFKVVRDGVAKGQLEEMIEAQREEPASN